MYFTGDKISRDGQTKKIFKTVFPLLNPSPELARNRAFDTIHFFFHFHQDERDLSPFNNDISFDLNYQKITFNSIRNLDLSTIIS